MARDEAVLRSGHSSEHEPIARIVWAWSCPHIAVERRGRGTTKLSDVITRYSSGRRQATEDPIHAATPALSAMALS